MNVDQQCCDIRKLEPDIDFSNFWMVSNVFLLPVCLACMFLLYRMIRWEPDPSIVEMFWGVTHVFKQSPCTNKLVFVLDPLQFDNIGWHGTKVVVFNLWLNDDGIPELDFEINKNVRMSHHLFMSNWNSIVLVHHCNFRVLSRGCLFFTWILPPSD